jgi:hypothetical protein
VGRSLPTNSLRPTTVPETTSPRTMALDHGIPCTTISSTAYACPSANARSGRYRDGSGMGTSSRLMIATVSQITSAASAAHEPFAAESCTV